MKKKHTHNTRHTVLSCERKSQNKVLNLKSRIFFCVTLQHFLFKDILFGFTLCFFLSFFLFFAIHFAWMLMILLLLLLHALWRVHVISIYNPSFQESLPKLPLAGVQTKYENKLFSIVIQSQDRGDHFWIHCPIPFTLIRAHNRNREIANATATAAALAAATDIGSVIGTILVADHFPGLVVILLLLMVLEGKDVAKHFTFRQKHIIFYLSVFIKPFILSIKFWLHSSNSN